MVWFSALMIGLLANTSMVWCGSLHVLKCQGCWRHKESLPRCEAHKIDGGVHVCYGIMECGEAWHL
jgi:hypothetical protein